MIEMCIAFRRASPSLIIDHLLNLYHALVFIVVKNVLVELFNNAALIFVRIFK